MNNNIYAKIRQNKAFEKNDIFIYLMLIVFIISLFFYFLILPAKSNADGFAVYKGQDKILTYNFSTQTIDIESEFLPLTQTYTEGFYTFIKIFTNSQKQGFNLISISLKNSTVKMQDSTCSSSKDCTHLPSIKDSGMIYCAPHQLKIVPIGSSYIPPQTGGV